MKMWGKNSILSDYKSQDPGPNFQFTFPRRLREMKNEKRKEKREKRKEKRETRTLLRILSKVSDVKRNTVPLKAS